MCRLAALARFRLMRFAAVGVAAALLFFLLSLLFVTFGASPFAGSVAAYAIVFVVAYLAQRGWTFGAAHAHRDALPRYLAAQLACAMMSGLVAQICIEGFAWSPLWMSVAVTATAGATSYLLSSRWVFSSHSRRSRVRRTPS
jgi:putative flippase GtrA